MKEKRGNRVEKRSFPREAAQPFRDVTTDLRGSLSRANKEERLS